MAHKHSFEKVQAWILRRGLLKIHNFKLTEKTPKDFLYNYLKTYKDYPTLFARSGKEQPTGWRRSAGDLFRITRFYFPDITLEELYRILIDLCIKRMITSTICPTVQKRVYYFMYYNTGFCHSPTDEYGFDLREFSNYEINDNDLQKSCLKSYKI